MTDSVEEWFVPRAAEIGPGFKVRRVLPKRGGEGVGPFVFLDHMGPLHLEPGQRADVPSHPHIGLSTVTYLFEGQIDHRDSLGSEQIIRAGEVNWMTAGRGIVHAEKTPPDQVALTRPLHGVQAWVALPLHEEDRAASFEHVGGDRMPVRREGGLTARVIAGTAWGLRSPVSTYSPLFYVHCEMEDGATVDFDPTGQEAALYVVNGSVRVGDQEFAGPGLIKFRRGTRVLAQAVGPVRAMLLGGEAFAEHRTIWWNFVSTSREKIEAAKEKWRAQAMGKVAGENDWVPLPGDRPGAKAGETK